MAKKPKFDLGAAVREIARESIDIPKAQVIPSKKRKPVKHKKREANDESLNS